MFSTKYRMMGKPVPTGSIHNDAVDALFDLDFGKQTPSSAVYVLKPEIS